MFNNKYNKSKLKYHQLTPRVTDGIDSARFEVY